MKRVLGKLVLGAALVVSVPVGIVAGVWAFFAAAHATDSVALLMVSGAVALVVATGGVSALACAWLTRPDRGLRRWLAPAVAAGTLAVTGLLWSALVLEPMDHPYVQLEAPEQMRYWELPTGSRLAWTATRAEDGGGRPPVIWLHGGPGAPDRLSPHSMDRTLAAAGHDVYRYHQVGSGLSSRLDDPTEYTVRRHVADLEAIREEIGAERVILAGGSWGATLAVHYLAAHPDRVERLLISGPGAIWQPAWGATIGEITDGSETDAVAEAVTPRFAVVYYLQRINPRAAQNLASDEEMSAFFQSALSPVIAGDIGRCGEERPDGAAGSRRDSANGPGGAREAPASATGSRREWSNGRGGASDAPASATRGPDGAPATATGTAGEPGGSSDVRIGAANGPGAFVPPGFGFYAHMVTAESQNRVPDPRPALRRLDLPVLVVRGECDRIRPEIALEYTEVFANSELVVVEGAAHSVAGAPEFPRIATEFILGDDAEVTLTACRLCCPCRHTLPGGASSRPARQRG